MKRYLNYLKYVIRHKYYVLRGAAKVDKFNLRLLYRALLHDASKFKPSEFIPYARTFYARDGSKQYDETEAFNIAWNHHQKRNKHHHQYWRLVMDRGDQLLMPMDDIYIKEMIADWIGAGWAITGKWDNVFTWYRNNNVGECLHPDTRRIVGNILANLEQPIKGNN